ncbi:MAG: 2-C-methyl-D-erythritol 4-phosphate cytidylyltransferase [Lachnospiraceae bacterium]|nr:2-C-methyl-D-erythritol 4-phosphate cytidylyltransferase [Lachnospiraceae bacterium]
MNTAAIIVAAGAGKRMRSSVRKQYIDILGYPVLYYTVKAFEESSVDKIVIVTGADETELVKKEIVEKYGFAKVVCVCEGGRERFDSVYAGIRQAALSGAGHVLIHDGVRMFVTPGLIDRCIESVRENGACVAAVPVKDTLKECTPCDESGDTVCVAKTLDRSTIWQVQTPQCFETSLIKDAFEKMYAGSEPERSRITDDAMVAEIFTDHKVTIVEGDYRNIKITTPEDLELARFLVARNQT